MTRDPARIDLILADLRRYWHAAPVADPTDHLTAVRAALDAASKATPGEWECEPVDVFGTLTEWAALIGPRRPGSDWPRKSDLRHEDAVAIVALHNAAPAIAEMCAEVERLQAERDSARDSMATAHVTAAKVGDELIETRAELARVTECYSESHAAVVQLTRDIDAGREIDRQNVAEINRLTAELTTARAEADCGQAGVCAIAPGCARHWQERNRELAEELARRDSAGQTVGALLEPAHIVEFDFEGDWHQAKRVDRLRYWQVRYWKGRSWSSWHDSDARVIDAWQLPARTVPTATCDDSPDTRGPIGGAP